MELKYNNIDYLNESISVLPQEDKEKLKSILSENFYKKGERRERNYFFIRF